MLGAALLVAVGVAVLLAALDLPAVYDPLLYAGAAAWVLATALYRAATRQPIWRVNMLGAVLAVGIYALYQTYVNVYAAPASVQVERSLQALEEGRRAVLSYFAQTAAHTAAGANAVMTAALVLAPFTLGISAAVAMYMIDAAIDSINELMSAAAGYLGYAYTALSILRFYVRMVEIFPAVYTPLALMSIGEKRALAAAGYASALPLLVAVAVALAPGLEPPTGALASWLEPFSYSGAVTICADAPVVAELQAPYVYFNGTHWVNSTQTWWYTVEGCTDVALPNGTWVLTRVIYSWAEFPAGMRFTLNQSGVSLAAANVTMDNYTQTAAVLQLTPGSRLHISLPYAWFDGWSVAATEAPRSVGLTGGAVNATWVFSYDCYGYVSECPGAGWSLSGLAALFRGLHVTVVHAENAEASYSASSAHVAVPEEDWGRICRAADSAVLRVFGAGCAPHHNTTGWDVRISVSSTPVIECQQEDNSTVCYEVPARHAAVVRVSLLYSSAPAPQVFGFVRGNETAGEATDRAFAFGLMAFPPFGGLGSLAAEFVKPLAWIWESLIPYVLRLVAVIVAVTAGTAGALVLAGAGAPLLKTVGLGMIARMRLELGWAESLPFRAARWTSAALYKPTAAVPAVAQAAAKAAVAKAAEEAGRRVWALYVSSAATWAHLLWRLDPVRLGGHTAATLAAALKSPLRVEARFRPLAALLTAAARLLHGMHMAAHPGAGLTPEQAAAKAWGRAAEAAWMLSRLRLDYFTALYLSRIFNSALLYAGDVRLAAAWTFAVLRPARHAGDVAVFAAEHLGAGARMIPATPRELAEGYERVLGMRLTPEQAAERYLRRFGYDYHALRRTFEELSHVWGGVGPEALTAALSSAELRERVARLALEELLRGNAAALGFASLAEFRLLGEQYGLRISPEGRVEPALEAWVMNPPRSAQEALEAALEPGPLAREIQLYEPMHTDYSDVERLRRALDGDVFRLERALREAVADVLPPDVINRGLPSMFNPAVLEALRELVKAEEQQWFEKLPEHVQRAALERLPFGDWSYVEADPYHAALVGALSWVEAEGGRLVVRSAVEYMPPDVREAYGDLAAAARLHLLDSPAPAVAAEWTPAQPPEELVRLAKALRVEGYEVCLDPQCNAVEERTIRPEDLAGMDKLLLAEAARFSAATERHWDVGDDVPMTLEGQLQRVAELAADPEAAAAAHLRWLAENMDDLAQAALDDGPAAAMQLSRLAEELEALLRPLAAGAEEDKPVEEAEEPVGEQFEPVEVEEAVEDRYEPVVEELVGKADGPAAAEVDHVEALRRMGIDIDKWVEEAEVEEILRRHGIEPEELWREAPSPAPAEEEAVASPEELARRYGIPPETAGRLVEEYGEYAEAAAENVARVDGWLARVDADDEARRRIIAERLDDAAMDPDAVIRELAEKAAEKAPKELRDLVAEDLAAGRVEEVNWKLAQVEQYCEAKGGCTPEERREAYRLLE